MNYTLNFKKCQVDLLKKLPEFTIYYNNIYKNGDVKKYEQRTRMERDRRKYQIKK